MLPRYLVCNVKSKGSSSCDLNSIWYPCVQIGTKNQTIKLVLLINWNQNYNHEKTFLNIQPSSLSGQVGFLKKLISRLNFIIKY